jgi:hypothetical protein
MFLFKFKQDQGYLLMNDILDTFQQDRRQEGMYLGWAADDFFDINIESIPVAQSSGKVDYGQEYHMDDYYITWSIPKDITGEIKLGKNQA